MRLYLTIVTILISIIFSGCSSKKYFEPAHTSEATGAITSHKGKSKYLTRDGVTFDNNKYVSKYGSGDIVLKNNEIYLSESKNYLFTTDQYGKLVITNKKSKKVVKSIKFDVPIVSVGLKDGLIVYLLQDNTFGIYKISDDTKLVENKAEDAFAVDSRIASPMFIDNLAVIPTLDGKLLIMDMYHPENAKVIYISSSSKLNNVIYLSRVGNLLVTATPNRVMTIGTAEGEFSKRGISEVAISKGSIYLFTKAGEVIKMDSSLKQLAYKKFKFAHFSTGGAFGGRVYALDQKGSLIVLDKNLKKSHIYDIGEVKDFAFISNKRLYKDNIIVSLDKLSL
jgi:hypothetical protein